MSLARELTVDFLQVKNNAFIASATVNTLSVTGSAVLPVVTADTITAKTLILENAAGTDQAVLSVVTDTLNIDSTNIILNGNVNITGNLVTSNGITQVIVIVDNTAVTHTMTFVSGILTAYTAV
jgi:hypothetical protein